MKTISQEEVASVVQSYLDRQQPSNYRLNVDRTAIEFKHDYWYVTVVPDERGVSSFDYAQHLTMVEEQIEEREGIQVLLVPTLAAD